MQRYVRTPWSLLPGILYLSASDEINEGRGLEHPLGKYINLDLRHLGAQKILEKLPGIRNICIDFIGIDPILEPIPIMPCQHYSMGGIDTNEKCETAIKGFYAAGECACVSVHGANRLGGNSLLDTIVFGKLASFAIDAYLQNNAVSSDEKLLLSKKEELEKKIYKLTHEGTEKPYTILADLSKIMSSNVGIFRIKDELERAVQDIIAVKQRFKNVHVSSSKLHMNHELLNAIELEYMLEVAHTIALGAFLREESRGAHFRKDFNSRNDADWLKHTIARIGKDGEPVISSKEVVITKFQPMERKY